MGDETMHPYYDRRARDYDDWWLGRGLYAAQPRPGWGEEVKRLTALLASLEPVRVLDVACGTGFLTQHLRGFVVGLDQSQEMVELAQRRLPDGSVVRGSALSLPFAEQSFDRVLASHIYGHLTREEGLLFLREAGRVGRELLVIDAALREEAEGWQWPTLSDDPRWRVYKRAFTAEQLADEIGGGAVFEGRWFVAASAER